VDQKSVKLFDGDNVAYEVRTFRPSCEPKVRSHRRFIHIHRL